MGRDRNTSDLDASLLKEARRDPEAFGLFYDRHAQAVLTFFYRRTASPEIAADLTAETFAQALLSLRRFRRQEVPARAWLFGIARHVLLKTLRRERIERRARRRLGVEPIPVDDLSFQRVEELVDFEPIKEAVQEAMSELSIAVREAVSLRVGLDLPYSEVAKRLGCTESAARVRVMRGLSRLADALEGS